MAEIEFNCNSSGNLFAGDTFVHDACVIDIVQIIDTNHVIVQVYPLYEGKVDVTLLEDQQTNFRQFQVPFRVTATTIFYSPTAKFTVLKVCEIKEEEPEPEPEPDPTDYITSINYDIVESIGDDEINFDIAIKNTSTSQKCFYVDLRDENGTFLERSPPLLGTIKLDAGESGTIQMTSEGAISPIWSVMDVQGQTVQFELKAVNTILGICQPTGYEIIETASYAIESYSEPEPEPEPEPGGKEYVFPFSADITAYWENDTIRSCVTKIVKALGGKSAYLEDGTKIVVVL